MDKEQNYYKNTYHHLYNRGANKAAIFYERENYLYFLRRMKFYADKYKIKILSYCLMPNHFHIFLKQTTNDFPVSLFISSLLNSYVKSISKKYKHSGTMFESKTKSKQIDDWEFSNTKDLLGLRNGNLIDTKYVTSFFQSKESMIKFLRDKTIKVSYEF